MERGGFCEIFVDVLYIIYKKMIAAAKVIVS